MRTSVKAALSVRRLPIRLTSNPGRTITRFFWIGEDRARKILARVRSLDGSEVNRLVHEVVSDFGGIHPDLGEILAEHYHQAIRRMGLRASDEASRQLLIGSYFTTEYAHESAALFNPSMVPARH